MTREMATMMAPRSADTPSADDEMLVLRTLNAGETRTLGERLGRLLAAGDVVALHGFLGAGKTTLVQGIAAGLGVTHPATSPTFTLINEYTVGDGLTVAHVDVYRLGGSDHAEAPETETLGLDEYLAAGNAVVLVEWAERIGAWLPEECLHVTLEARGAGDERVLTFVGRGARSAALVAALRVWQ